MDFMRDRNISFKKRLKGGNFYSFIGNPYLVKVSLESNDTYYNISGQNGNPTNFNNCLTSPTRCTFDWFELLSNAPLFYFYPAVYNKMPLKMGLTLEILSCPP